MENDPESLKVPFLDKHTSSDEEQPDVYHSDHADYDVEPGEVELTLRRDGDLREPLLSREPTYQNEVKEADN